MPTELKTPRFSEDEQYQAKRAVDRGVIDIVQVTKPDRTGLVSEPLHPGSPTMKTKPLPLLGIRAALLLESTAHLEIYEHARRARGAGSTWDDIAEVLVSPARDRLSNDDEPWRRRERAFEKVADFVDSRDYPAQLSWHCATCGGHVTEYHPNSSSPEKGHEPGCHREEAEKAAQATQWDED